MILIQLYQCLPLVKSIVHKLLVFATKRLVKRNALDFGTLTTLKLKF